MPSTIDNATIPEAPTYTNPIIVDEFAKQGRFNPAWLDWFLRLRFKVNEVQGGCNSLTTDVATTTYVVSAADECQVLNCTNASGCAITIPAGVMPVGALTFAIQNGAAQAYYVAGSGVTIETSDTNKTRTVDSMIGAKQIATDVWEMIGDLEPYVLALSVLVRDSASNGAPRFLQVVADGHALIRRGGAIIWAFITASDLVNVPSGNISAVNVQNAINELDTEKGQLSGANTWTQLNQFNEGICVPASGGNKRIGNAVLVAGTVTVATNKATSSAEIFLTRRTPGGTVGDLRIGTIVGGTSFDINSSNAADTSTVSWWIVPT